MVETCPVQWYPNKQAMPADKVSSPENNYNTLCAVKDRANVKAKGIIKEYAVFPQLREFVEKRRGGSYYEVIPKLTMSCVLTWIGTIQKVRVQGQREAFETCFR
jgi:hypothetical protein